MKDRFSTQAGQYAQFRPEYPEALFDFVLARTPRRENLWDCATGNGQAAKVLCRHFKNVFATDISQKQLDNAFRAGNIFYSKQAAETTDFQENTFDLITVAQALHWFDFDRFFAEARRVARPGGRLAVWGYSTASFDEKPIRERFHDFFQNRLGPYWDPERQHLEEHFAHIRFPLQNVENQSFEIVLKWHRHEFEGYLNSCSAVVNFIKMENFNPVDDFLLDLGSWWGEFERKTLRFPVFLKTGIF